MARQLYLAPNGTAQIAAGIAQGANAFMGNYMSMQKAQREAEARQAEMELRRAQIAMEREKFEAEYAPQKVNLQKLGVMMDMLEKGVPVPESVVKDQWQQTLENTDDPNKVQMLENFGQFLHGRKNPAGQPDLPTGAPRLGGQAGYRPMVSAGDYTPMDMTVNRTEREILEKGLSARTSTNLANIRAQNQLDLTNLKNMNEQQLLGLKGQIEAQIQSLKNTGAQTVAQTNAGAKTGAAKTAAGAKIQVEGMGIAAGKYNRAGRGSGNAATKLDEATKSLWDKSVAVLTKPGMEGIITPPQVKRQALATITAIAERHPQLQSARDALLAAIRAGSGAPNPNPNAGAATTSLKAAAKAAKPGKQFEFGGKKYKKIDDAHIEEVVQ